MAERSALEERALRDALRNAAMIELYAGRARVRAGVRVFMDDAQRRGWAHGTRPRLEDDVLDTRTPTVR